MTTPAPERSDARPRVLVAGGGVAALEACLALRAALGDERLAIDLLSPVAHLDVRALSVLDPFGDAPARGLDLAWFAADQDVRLVTDALEAVDVADRCVATRGGRRLPFGHLLVAIGAEAVRAIPGAVTFRGARDADAVRRTIDGACATGRTLAFAVPNGGFWTLPAYELALMAAARVAGRGRSPRIALVTPEPVPLYAFGEPASARVARLLDARGVRFVGAADAIAADAGDLELADGRRLQADAVVALPRLRGPRPVGLPHDAEGFVPVDGHGRVVGCDRVLAAGDVTDFPLKQGGLATQQADAAAEAILAELGALDDPAPFRPVLRGVLFTDREPVELRGPAASADAAALWWPPGKIAGRRLWPYLIDHAAAPSGPPPRPWAEEVPVDVHLARVVAGERSALGANALPPG